MTVTKASLRVAAALFVVIVGACESDDDSKGSSPSSSASSPNTTVTALVGTTWLLSDETELGVPMSSVQVTAEFRGGRLSGNSGCNGYTTSYEVQGTNLTIGPELTGTLMACEPGPMVVEEAYRARLPQVATYEIDGSTLTLRGAEREELLVFEARDPATAILGRWTATSYYTGEDVRSVITGSTLTADFDAHQVSGNSVCNVFSGPSRLSGNSIDIAVNLSTTRACVDPALAGQEEHYLAALELAATFRVTGTTLELFRPDGGIAATFTASAAAG